MFSSSHNRNRSGQFSHKDSSLTKAERAEKRAAMEALQAKMREEQKARHAAFNESLRAILAENEAAR